MCSGGKGMGLGGALCVGGDESCGEKPGWLAGWLVCVVE